MRLYHCNINSVSSKIDLLKTQLETQLPHIITLNETKLPPDSDLGDILISNIHYNNNKHIHPLPSPDGISPPILGTSVYTCFDASQTNFKIPFNDEEIITCELTDDENIKRYLIHAYLSPPSPSDHSRRISIHAK